MDFEKVIKGVMTAGNYQLMRNSGSTPVELKYFHDHKELEKQYQANISPEQIGREIIDAESSKARGELQ